jgi:acyl carrier protein
MANMEMCEIKKRVMEVIKRNAVFNADKVNENSRIRRDHGIDSIKLVEMIIDLEK